MYRNTFISLLLVFSSVFFGGCFSVKYSTTGAVISPDIKSVGIAYFPNRAPQVNPTLSQKLTDDLRERMRNQTSLIVTNDIGDVYFEGEINGYDIRPMAITGDQVAAQNRFTISVRVKYTNLVDPTQSFDTSFSRYEDFTGDFSSSEDAMLKRITELLVEDIYNKAFVNW